MGLTKKYTIIRRPYSGYYDDDGNYQRDLPTTITIKASVQMPTVQDTVNAKFGTSTSDVVKIYTKADLLLDKEANGDTLATDADMLVYDGRFWKIISRNMYDSIASMQHRKYFAKEVTYEPYTAKDFT